MKQLNDIEYASLIREVLTRIITEGDETRYPVIIPNLKGLWQEIPGYSVHVCYEIFFQIDGGCRFQMPDEEILLHPDNILILPPGVPHKERSFSLEGKSFRNLLITLSENYLDTHIAESPQTGKKRHIPEPVYPEKIISERKNLYCNLADSIKTSALTRNPNGKTLRFRTIQTLLAMILEELGDPLIMKTPDNVDQEHYKIMRAKLIINRSDLAKPPSVTQLAKRVGCSANYLSWLFRKETGSTLKSYLNQVKMERASNMLLHTTRSISEIAWSCGFKDAAYFSRIFERFHGCKPSEFRKEPFEKKKNTDIRTDTD